MDRVVDFGVRVLTVAEQLQHMERPHRVVDQLTGCGASPGAHLFEANEAVSRRDFINLVSGGAKELSETRYWLRVIVRMAWIHENRLAPLLKECTEWLCICKSIVARTRARNPSQMK